MKFILSIVRHGITVGAGWMAARGVEIDQGVVDGFAHNAAEIVAAILLYAAAQAWSLIDKRPKLEKGKPGTRTEGMVREPGGEWRYLE